MPVRLSNSGPPMFFNAQRKKAHNTALMIENAFRAHFAATNHISPKGEFHPPDGFYFDRYILGYTVSLANLFMTHTYGLGNMASEKKGQFTLDVISELSITPSEAQRLKTKFLSEWQILQTTDDYTQ